MYDWLLDMLPCLILWTSSIAKNKAKFDDKVMNASNIIESIRTQIFGLHQSQKVILHKGKTPLNCINFFNLPFTIKSCSIKLIVWVKPSNPWVKLNVDGASKGNPGEVGDGRILRNSSCHFLLAFAEYLG